MDLSKKRKMEENGAPIAGVINGGSTSLPPPTLLTPDDARKILEAFSQDQLLSILQNAAVRHPDVLDAVRSIADGDITQRKLFIRGLGWETTTEKLRALFTIYGELDEAVVIFDKVTGKSKGFGFITFRHIDGAILALKEPSKKIDGRMTVTQLAAAGASGPTANAVNASSGAGDVSLRKIYVGNVPQDMPSERLLGHFLSYGEIVEGPLGFDKETGKSRGFAFFVYKTEEGARAALVDPAKNIDGQQMVCKLAVDGKKAKAGDGGPPQSSMPGQMSSQYGVPPYGGGYTGNFQGPPMLNSFNGGGGGYSGSGGSAYGNSQFGGPASGEYGGPAGGNLSNAGSSMYRLPPSSMGMPSGGYPESGNSGLNPGAYPAPSVNQAPSLPRGPPGGMYPGMPPYY